MVPTQIAIGLLLFVSADSVPALLGSDEEKPQVMKLTFLFFNFFLLCATQDIAVDGWALEMLSKKNRAWASTCNSVGLTLGYTLSFQGFLALKTFGYCDFPAFMKISGVAFLLTTAIVAFFKKETRLADEDAPVSVYQAYKSSYEVCRLSSVRLLIFALITRSVAFAATETLTTRKLLAMGMKKEMIATIAGLLIPISVVLPGILTRYTTEKPLSFFTKTYLPRMVLGMASAMLVYSCPSDLHHVDQVPLWFWLSVLALSIAASILSSAQFVSLMAFFAQVSDPLVGGSYMTTLNTATNLGSKWPNTLVLFAVNQLTWKQGSDCDAIIPKDCEIILDGYYILTFFCLAVGFAWMKYFDQKLCKLELEKEHVWRVPRQKLV